MITVIWPLLSALKMAKESEQWATENRRYIPKAYKWLQKAIIGRDYFLIWYTVCHTKGHIIPDAPRFKALIKPVVSGRED